MSTASKGCFLLPFWVALSLSGSYCLPCAEAFPARNICLEHFANKTAPTEKGGLQLRISEFFAYVGFLVVLV
jgi:hypothetical protein